jgi:4-amino-4-deoxy-L-arabinose transferase-like glycosyltransferase
MSRFRRHWPIVLLVSAFVLVAFTYSVANPLHEATDELRHYRFVRTIVETGRLPVQGQEACRSQSHHPPLIYLLGAAATFWVDTGRDVCQSPPTNPFWGYRYADVGTDNKNLYLHSPDESFPWYGEALAAHIVRGLNVLIGAGVVLLTWATGRAIWPEKTALALGGAAFVAFNPMFLYMSGAINNDVIAALSGAAVLYGCVRLLRDPAGLSWRWGVVLGTLYGLALMSKFNMAAVLLLIGVAVTWTARQKKQWREWWQVNIVIVVTAGLLVGWWFVRNQLLYGEPTGFQILTELWGARDPVESLPVAISELPYLWTTLWGRFGFGQIPLPELAYDGLRWLVAIGLLGVLLPLVRRELRETPFAYLLLLVLTVLLNFGVVFNYMLVSPAGAMGRFFFPGLPALSLLIFYGLYLWGRLVVPGPEQRWLPGLAWGANLIMLALALIALFGFVVPAYARPDSFTDADVPNPVNAQFDGLVNLRGYGLNTTEIRPGDMLELDLFWEVTARPPGDFLLFVHLIDENSLLITQRDTHPGLGKFPSSQWQPGDRFQETIRLPIPETAYTPNMATLSIGLYAPTYRLGITGPDGAGWGDALPLETIALQPLPGDLPNTQRQNFNNEIMLRGYEYDQGVLRPGDVLAVTLYWQALADNLPDYEVQVQLMDPQNPVGPLSRADTRPQDGARPTDTWVTGEEVPDSHRLSIPADLPAGAYEIHIALLDAETGRRQNIVAEDGHWINNHLILAPVLVQP